MGAGDLCIVLLCLMLGTRAVVTDACRMAPIDIRDHGVWIDKVAGSRVEYTPFPGNFLITPGKSIQIEFNTSEPDGVLFVVGSLETGDMVAILLSGTHLVLIRHCHSDNIHEQYQQDYSDGQWHKLLYIHSRTGGEVQIDGKNPFREYYIGPCSDFNSVIFGGLPPDMEIETLEGKDLSQRFHGCLRKMRIDGKIPLLHPEYTTVSGCDYTHH